jgi:hypothetical protein
MARMVQITKYSQRQKRHLIEEASWEDSRAREIRISDTQVENYIKELFVRGELTEKELEDEIAWIDRCRETNLLHG